MKLTVVGLGPGAGEDLTGRARQAIAQADLVVGYSAYIALIRDAFPNKEMISTGMKQEEARCRAAVAAAAGGKNVAVVCSGDAGIYGMAGLVYEVAQEYPPIEIEVIPGITAACGGAAVLGAPLTHDFAVISLSDLLTPWQTISRRLEAAAEADFVICLYNPRSRGRAEALRRACDILLRHKPAETVCGFVRNIGYVYHRFCGQPADHAAKWPDGDAPGISAAGTFGRCCGEYGLSRAPRLRDEGRKGVKG